MALCPEVAILLLVELQLLFTYNVDILQFTLAIPAHDVLLSGKYRFAAKTGSLDLSEFEEAYLITTHSWLVYIPCVLSREYLLLGALTKDRLEDSDQRLLELIIEVIFSVDWQVVL